MTGESTEDWALSTSEQINLLRVALDSSIDCVFAKDHKFRLILVNKSLAMQMNMTPEQMENNFDYNFWPKEKCFGDPEKGIRGYHDDDRLALNGKTIRTREKVEFADKVEHVFETTRTPLKDSDGNIYAVLGIARDITNDLLIEEKNIKLEEKNKELEYSKERYRNLFNRAGSGIITADAQGTILTFNKAAEKLFGYSASEIIGQNVRDLTRGKVKDEHDSYIENYHATEISKMIGVGREVQGRHKNGDILELYISISESINDNKKYFMAIIHDISESKRHNTALENAKNEAVNANRAKSEFLSSMSHELRTPLNAIVGFSQLFKLNENLNDLEKEHIDEIYNAGLHLLDLINDVLDLAKIESDRINLELKVLNLHQIIKDCIAISSPIASDNNVSIDYLSSEEGSFQVYADIIRLKQVMLNLLSNAIKYNRPDGTVTISSETYDEKYIRIKITDTGKGLDEEQQSKLFLPFERLGEEKGGVQGTGIGLVITKELVEKMGGSIGIESEKNLGSTFWVSLPISESLKDVRDEIDVKESTKDSLNNNLIKILYIEDNLSNRCLLKAFFNRDDRFEYQDVESAEDAMSLLKNSKPDIILLDIDLPGMDGYEFMVKINDNPALSEIPIIAVTAQAMTHDIEKANDYNFSGYVTKPIMFEELERAILRSIEA